MSRPNFDALRELHNSANDLLHSPIIRRTLVHHQQDQELVHAVSEASLRMLDVCGTTKDVLLLVKDHLQDLQSTFRRISFGERAVDQDKFEAYTLYRKKLRKEMAKRLRMLKDMKDKYCIMSPMDHNLVLVVNVLGEVRVTTMSIVESLMELMSMPCPNRKRSHRATLAAKLTRANSLTLWGKCDAVTVQTAYRRLEAVEIAIEDLQVELECMFRRLIETRVSLLNILTSYD